MSEARISYREARRDQARTLAGAIGQIREQVVRHQREQRLSGPGPIFAAIGASLAATAAPVWVMRSRGIHSWRLGAGDLPIPFPPSTHPVFGVSQSGRSPETITVLESTPPDLRCAVTNWRPSPVDELARTRVWLGNLPDSYASTIGYTATLVSLGMIADAWSDGPIDPAWDAIPALVDAINASARQQIAAFAERVADAAMADFVGGGPAVGSAESGALLLREVARVPSAALSTREYLHGPMESAARAVHILLGDAREAELAGTLSEAGRPVLLLTALEIQAAPCLEVVRLPDLPPSPRAVLEAVAMQMLAEEVADRTGVDPEAFVFHNADTKVPDDRSSDGSGLTAMESFR